MAAPSGKITLPKVGAYTADYFDTTDQDKRKSGADSKSELSARLRVSLLCR